MAFYLFEIETVVGGKAIIFRSDNSPSASEGDLIERNPSMMPYRLFAFEELLGTADYHEGVV